jgi:hypothetical protein
MQQKIARESSGARASIYNARAMASAIQVAILREQGIARVTVDGKFIGDFTSADATLHAGAIINPANYLARIADCAAHGHARASRESSVEARVSFAFDAAILDEQFTDTVTVTCKLARSGNEDELAELTRECARLRERCARIERALCMRGVDIPSAGRAFYMALEHRARSGHPIVFPMMGPDFVMIGARFYRWEYAEPVVMRASVVCCYIPQTGNANIDARIEYTADPPRVWATDAIATVGARGFGTTPRFVAARADCPVAPRGYVALRGFDAQDFFGVALSDAFDIFCRAADAASYHTIEREFKGAIAITREFTRDADASGMIPF